MSIYQISAEYISTRIWFADCEECGTQAEIMSYKEEKLKEHLEYIGWNTLGTVRCQECEAKNESNIRPY